MSITCDKNEIFEVSNTPIISGVTKKQDMNFFYNTSFYN
jgi:hypothetical protein